MKNESLQSPGGQMVADGEHHKASFEPELGVNGYWFNKRKTLCLDKMQRKRNVKERERGIEKARENKKKRHEGAIEVPNLSNCWNLSSTFFGAVWNLDPAEPTKQLVRGTINQTQNIACLKIRAAKSSKLPKVQSSFKFTRMNWTNFIQFWELYRCAATLRRPLSSSRSWAGRS